MKRSASNPLCSCGAVMIRHRDKVTGETFLVCWRWPECERAMTRQLAAVGGTSRG